MFFTSISQMMTESVDLTLVIRKANGQLTVSTLPKANGLKDEAQNHIVPLTLTGTPEEMDAEFLQHIMQPIRKATGLISNLMEFEKQADKAAANSKAAKDAKAKETIEEQKDKYLRLSAEFDNYRKRTMKEKAELILNGGEKSLSSILPVVDDFERAIKTMETATDVNAVKEGVELIYNKFMAVLAQNGVKVIETKDQPLDTDYHEAIAVIPAPSEAQKGKILDCVQKEYTLNDKVLRHAKVVVGE